jgi:pentatricopeptide repeat protein
LLTAGGCSRAFSQLRIQKPRFQRDEAFKSTKILSVPHRRVDASPDESSPFFKLDTLNIYLKKLRTSTLDNPLDQALSILKQTHKQGLQFSHRTAHLTMELCGSPRLIHRMAEVRVIMQQYGIVEDVATYAVAVKTLGQAGASDMIPPLMDEMESRGIHLNSYVLWLILEIYRREARYAQAWTVFNQHVHFLGRQPYIYTTMLHVCHKTEDLERAVSVFEQMLAHGVPPTGANISELWACFKVCNQLERGSEYFHSRQLLQGRKRSVPRSPS